MSYDIVFNADGSVSLPDLPAELFPAVRALRTPLPEAAAAGTVGACAEQDRSNRPEHFPSNCGRSLDRTTPDRATPIWWRTRHTPLSYGRSPDRATSIGSALQRARSETGPSLQPSGDRSPAWAKQPKARDRATPEIDRTELFTASNEALWDLHAAQVEARAWRTASEEASGARATLLDLKVELARRSLLACDLCARQCGADRWHDEPGACGSVREGSVTRVFLNWSEEPHLRPGVSVFLSGCNWDCVYCQYPENLDAHAGQVIAPTRLAERIEALRREGATNVHWVGGNPDQHLRTVLRTLQQCQAPLPVVWNTNGYASPTTLRLLDGVVDVYLVDFRHGTSACAERYGVPGDSVDIIQRNLRRIAAQDAALIVRHLQLPEHFDCCTAPILRWLAAELPDVPLNLMHGQYRPAHLAYQYPEINRRLTRSEREKTDQLAHDLGSTLVK